MAEAVLASLPPGRRSARFNAEIEEARRELEARRQRALFAVACEMGNASDAPGALRTLEFALATETVCAHHEPVDDALRVAAARLLRARRAKRAGALADEPKPEPAAAEAESADGAPPPVGETPALDAGAVAATTAHVRALLREAAGET